MSAVKPNPARRSIFAMPFNRTKLHGEVIQVGVAFPGRRELIEVRLTDKVLDLKQKVFETVGIPVERQEMHYGNKTLKNKNTLKHYKIESERTIMLKGNLNEFISVRPSDPILQQLMKARPVSGKHGSHGVDQGDVKLEEEEEGGEHSRVPVFEVTSTYTLRCENREIEGLVISKKSEIGDLAAQIQKALKLQSMQNMILVRAGTPVDARESLLAGNNKTVADLDLDQDEVLELRALNVTFRVSLPGGKVVTVDLDRDADVSELVGKLLALDLDDPETLVLMREDEVLPTEGASLSSLGITTGAFLDLKRSGKDGDEITIRFEWEDDEGEKQSAEIQVSPEEEVWDVMRKAEGVGAGNAQRMQLTDADGNDLDEEGTLAEFGVQDGDTLIVSSG